MKVKSIDMKILEAANINPFGGINFIYEELDKLKIGELLNKELPELAKQSKYDWRDILYSYWSVFFCGGDCAEDLSDNFRTSLEQNPYISIPSPDRVLNRIKQMSKPACIQKLKRGTSIHKFAIHPELNQLNIAILKRLFPNLNNDDLTLDYDNTICYTGKKDALLTYKKETGYQPGVGFIGSKAVYVENRNGNSTAHVLQEDTLSRMFELLLKNNIQITNFRADSASYNWRSVQVADKYSDNFYIRARMSQTLERAISSIEKWIQIGEDKDGIFRSEIIFTPFTEAARRAKEQDTLKEYRLIVTKEKRLDGKVNLFTNEACIYSSIVTNDFDKTMNEVVFFYNQRGAIEREFEVLKYDFGWNNLPYSHMTENNVYLLITAICKNIYHYIITIFSKIYSGLEPTFRLKKFIFRFITIPAKWIKQSRQLYLRVYGEISYKTE